MSDLLPEAGRRSRLENEAASRVARLFERHGQMVYAISRNMLRNTHDAEDATQQVFLSAHRALLGDVRVRDSGAWLATIARNECRGRIAAGMRAPLPLADDDLEAIAASRDETERRLQAQALKSALEGLPERQREAVVLRYFYWAPVWGGGDRARALEGRDRGLLFRARRALKVRLRPLVGAVLAVPLAVREELALAIPGFATTAGTSAAAAGAAGGVLAKLGAGSVGTKVAAATVAVSTVGTVGAAEKGPERENSDRARMAATVDVRASDDDVARGGRDSSYDPGGVEREGPVPRSEDGDGGGNSGPGGGNDPREDDGLDSSSGHGSGRADAGAENTSSSGSRSGESSPEETRGASAGPRPRGGGEGESGSGGGELSDSSGSGSGGSGEGLDSSGSGSGPG